MMMMMNAFAISYAHFWPNSNRRQLYRDDQSHPDT